MNQGTDKPLVVAGRYRLLRPLGTGAHGVVDLAEDLLRGDRPVALKRIEGIFGAGDPDPAAERLRWFLHPRWAEVLDEGRYGDHGRFQVTRYIPGQSLESITTPQDAEAIWRFLEDGARVLRAIHALGLIHYDVTPGNWIREMRPEGPVYTLTDGGLANLGPVRGIARGTPLYMAPELTEDRTHDHRIDLYSLGLVAWRLATGKTPWEGGAGEVLGARRRERCPSVRESRPDLPPELDVVLGELLEREPVQRPQDAVALLRRIESLRKIPVPTLLVEESIAAASGGPIVGRADAVARFRRSCRLIAATESVPSATASLMAAARHGSDSVVDPVLLVHGPSGSGGTRLLREFAAIARGDDLACVVVPGREGRADRRSPVRRLSDALVALTAGLPDPVAVPPPPRRPHPDEPVEGDGSAHAIERFVSLCENVATRLPLAILVEDFCDMPPGTQEAIRVLGRQLISRAEHPGGRAPLRLLLVVDHGTCDPSDTLVPDSSDPRRPLLPLAPLTDAELRTFTSARFPGASIPDADLPAIRTLTEGLPGAVVAWLVEACRRGDLHPETDGWRLDTQAVGAYRIDRALPPDLSRALEAAEPGLRALLDHLAILEEPLPEADCRRLLGRDELPSSPLLVGGVAGAGNRALAVVSGALRERLRSALSPDTATAYRSALIELLQGTTCGPLILERARLLLHAHRFEDALREAVRGAASAASTAARLKAQAIALGAVRADLALLGNPEHRLAVSGLLHVGPEGVALSELLAAALPDTDLPAGRRLAEFLFGARRYAEARRVIQRLLAGGAQDSRDTGWLLITSVRLEVSQAPRTVRQWSPQVLRVALALRRLGRRGRSENAALVAHYYLLRSHLLHLTENYDRSFLASKLALRRARTLPVSIQASALNNLALGAWHTGRTRLAQKLLRRAYEAKIRAGEPAAATNTLHNLARFARQDGNLLAAAATHTNASNIAVRFALHDYAVRSLEALASIYDQQSNPALARDVLVRAMTIALRASLSAARARSVRRLSVIEAAMGNVCAARQYLIASARLARKHGGEDLTEHFISSCTVDLHLGRPTSAAGKLTQARRWSTTAATLEQIACLELVCNPTTHYVRFPGQRLPLRTPTHRAFQALLAIRRFLAGVPDNARIARLLDTPGLYGTHQRLVCEGILAASRGPATLTGSAAGVLQKIAERSQRQHLGLLAARARARLLIRHESPVAWPAQDISLFLAAIDGAYDQWTAAQNAPRLPLEVGDVLGSLRRHARTSTGPSTLPELYALLQRLALSARSVDGQDSRLSAALRRVLEAASKLDTGGGLDRLLESLTRYGLEITGAERACLVLLKADAQLEIRVESASHAPVPGNKARGISHTVIQRVLAGRQPVLIHDVFGDDELMGRPSIATLSLRSVICAPLIRGASVYGVMYADSAGVAGSFDRVDLEVLTLFAQQAAAAIEASRLLADSQRSYGELKAVQERLLRGERLRVIGELTSGVAHEFNNLLTAILARIQLMELDDIPSDVRENLDQIQKAAADAAAVVRRLQGFARNQRQGEFKTLDLGALVADVIELLRPLWANRRLRGQAPITVQTRCPKGIRVRGDATELREVFTNLLKNSIEALDAGGTISLVVDRSDHRVRFRVMDTGPGIEAEDLARLFVPFFTTKGDRGTGLGLCLAQQIIERHSGEISITSSPGAGTTATVLLTEDQSAVAVSSPSREGVATPSNQAVLVIDDDPDVRGILSAYLNRCGYQVRSASSGAEGLSEVRKAKPDVVISDIAMPGMDGIELCKRLRAAQPQLPVILMSGQASAIEPERIQKAGAAALLAKPFTMKQVVELLGNLDNG